MTTAIPATPADALEIPAALRAVLWTVRTSADLLGYWNRPYAGAATAFEDMTLLDKLYWAYKCRKPVLQPEPALSPAPWASRPPALLPDGFAVTQRVRLNAVGDLIPTAHLEHSRDVLYEPVAERLFGADLTFAALESPVSHRPPRKEVISDKESPIESCIPAQLDAVTAHRDRRFSILHTASNHMFDLGMEGVEATLRELDARGLVQTGINRDPARAGRGTVLECKGLRIGFASATFGLNGRNPPAEQAWCLNAARLLPKRGAPDLAPLLRQIEDCRSSGCDFIFASLHWGYEFECFPRRRQVEIAHALVEAGADAVLGHHPHVVQPVEFYRTRRDPNRVAVIAYSLGSLLWWYTAPHLVLCAMLGLTLAQGRIDGTTCTFIERAQVTPLVRTYSFEAGVPYTRIQPLAAVRGTDAGYASAIERLAETVLGTAA